MSITEYRQGEGICLWDYNSKNIEKCVKIFKKNLSKSVDKVIVVCYSIIMCVIILLYYNQLLDKDKKMV